MIVYTKKTIRKGNKIRVLVVDDSAVIRRLVTTVLEQDESIEIAGTAPNGAIALDKITQVNPDIITLDIEMPGMDGLQMLRELRKTHKDIRVIMLSSHTERGGAMTIEALSFGANDYVAKATSNGSKEAPTEALKKELIPKIKQFFVIEGAENQQPPPIRIAAWRPTAPTAPILFTKPKVVAIGVSTGGPSALEVIMKEFPADFPVPILIVQHMPAIFTRMLAERLQTVSKLRVEEAVDGAVAEKGVALIAPGNYHMRLKREGTRTVVRLDQAAPENSCRPAVDVLFRSVEEVYGSAVITVILTGMGYDGLHGAQALKAHGSYVIAQDEASSVVWGMPGAVVQAGLADIVLPLDKIAFEIVRKASS